MKRRVEESYSGVNKGTRVGREKESWSGRRVSYHCEGEVKGMYCREKSSESYWTRRVLHRIKVGEIEISGNVPEKKLKKSKQYTTEGSKMDENCSRMRKMRLPRGKVILVRLSRSVMV